MRARIAAFRRLDRHLGRGPRAGGARAQVGAGCHPETPAVAHRGDAAVLDPQPAGGPIPCRSYTGFAGGESRIEVNDHGTVFFSPAPFLAGVLSLGYLPELDPDGSQWMFQQGGIAVSRDGGASFSFVEPSDGTYTMDDAHSYLDRDTGKYFWSVLNESPDTDPLPPGSAVPLLEAQILSSPDDGERGRTRRRSGRSPIARSLRPAARRPASRSPPVIPTSSTTATCFPATASARSRWTAARPSRSRASSTAARWHCRCTPSAVGR